MPDSQHGSSKRMKAAPACQQVYWLGLDYLKVASAALRSSACFMALLYIEEWCKETHGALSLGEDKLRDQVCQQLLRLSSSCLFPSPYAVQVVAHPVATAILLMSADAHSLLQDTLPVAEQLLLDIFSQVNEPDGIYAIAQSHKMASQLRLFEHEGSWSKALLGYDLLQQSAAGRPPTEV